MTSCAGICYFHPRNRQCVISLSVPLLKLRPRKDLVETLLHEMIHGYLFLTNNNRDRDGHGPEFCKHMNRINMEAGTNITIYHSFHDEVNSYKQHWWKCNGPCQYKRPYFGMVKRAMNRAPGPYDFWWADHRATCSGQFIKVKEPENFKAKNSTAKGKEKRPGAGPSNSTATSNTLLRWLPNTSTSTVPVNPLSTLKPVEPHRSTDASAAGIKKLGNSTNNVYGWGTKGPNDQQHRNTSIPNGPVKTTPESRQTPMFSGASVLGGSRTGRSNLLSKFDTTGNNRAEKWSKGSVSAKNTLDCWLSKSGTARNQCENQNQKEKENENENVNRYAAAKSYPREAEPSSHTSSLLSSSARTLPNHSTPTQKRKNNSSPVVFKKLTTDHCIVCDKAIPAKAIKKHYDWCLSTLARSCIQDEPVVIIDSDCDTKEDGSVISISSDSDTELSFLPLEEDVPGQSSRTSTNSSITDIKGGDGRCLACNMLIVPESSFNDHLKDCVGSIFQI